MRRFISTILALLVLLLSCLPCNDAKAAPETNCIETAQTDTHHTDHNEVDSCSPFCTCACCAGFILPVGHAVALPELTLLFRKQLTAHPQPSLLDAHLPVWQPPQLV